MPLLSQSMSSCATWWNHQGFSNNSKRIEYANTNGYKKFYPSFVMSCDAHIYIYILFIIRCFVCDAVETGHCLEKPVDVKVVNQTWRLPLWDTSPVGCFIVSCINFDSHLCLRWLYGQTTGEEPELHRFQQSSQLEHKRKHEIVGKDVKNQWQTKALVASLVGKSSWAVPQDRPSERGSQRHLECFLGFFAKGGRVPWRCRHAESCGMFLCMFLYSHEYILCTVMIHDAIFLYCRKRFYAQSLFWTHLIFILITECSTSYLHSLFNHICIYVYIHHISHTVSLSLYYVYTYTHIYIYICKYFISCYSLYILMHMYHGPSINEMHSRIEFMSKHWYWPSTWSPVWSHIGRLHVDTVGIYPHLCQ